MMRCTFILIFCTTLCQAQKFSAADVKQWKAYSTGSFSIDAVAKSDTHFLKSTLVVQPIWPKRKDGAWLFAVKTDSAAHYQVWHCYLQDDTTLLMQFLDFKDADKGAALSKDIGQQSKLYIYNLFPRRGCEVYLKKNKKGFEGISAGKECFANVPGVEYLDYKIAFTKNTISWSETGYDKEDKLVMGSPDNVYTFSKQAKPLK
jgi:hypothetical protein